MGLSVTLDVFSGRPNPKWQLSAVQTREFLGRMERLDQESTSKPPGARGTLGYRGFVVSGSAGKRVGSVELFVHGALVDRGPRALAVYDSKRGLEDWLLRSGQGEIGGVLTKHVREQLAKPVKQLVGLLPRAAGACPVCQAKDAPAYAPGPWNTPANQPKNNCYNYANNQMTGTFAQPGRATGKPITGLSCGGVQPSAVSDGLAVAPGFNAPRAKGQGWYVALVIWPGSDYHWYRQDSGGCWSHKPGSTPVRNVDNSGKAITDPRTCNRGPYTVFCSYMVTHSKVRIR